MLSGIREEDTHHANALQEWQRALVPEADAERSGTTQVALDQQMLTESVRMSFGEELRHAKEIAKKASEESQALPGSIAKYMSTYSSEIDTLIAEREMPSADAPASADLDAVLGEVARLLSEHMPRQPMTSN